jgi:hypothetical protein
MLNNKKTRHCEEEQKQSQDLAKDIASRPCNNVLKEEENRD